MLADLLRRHSPTALVVRHAALLVPFGVAALGVAHALFNLLAPPDYAPTALDVVRAVWFPLLIPPLFSWLVLRWLTTALPQATTLENAHLHHEARRRALHLETASALGQEMTTLQQLDSLLPQVVRLIQDKFGLYLCSIFLLDEPSGEFALEAVSGPAAERILAQGPRLRIGHEGIIGWVGKTGESLLCNDISREPRYLPNPLVPDTKAELALPLRVDGRVIGVLDVQSDHTDAFDQEDITVLRILGNQIASAIENTRLFQETKHRYEAMIALHATSLDIVAQLDTSELLAALVQRGTQLLGAESGGLALYNANKESIYTAASYNTTRDWARDSLPKAGVVGHVLKTGKAVIVNDYPNWPDRFPAAAGLYQMRVVGDAATRDLSFRAGESDLALTLGSQILNGLEKDGFVVTRRRQGSGAFVLVPDSANSKSPFAEIKVRR